MNEKCPYCWEPTDTAGNCVNAQCPEKIYKRSATPSGWICPRCQTVHNPSVMTCNCPPTYTITWDGNTTVVPEDNDAQ